MYPDLNPKTVNNKKVVDGRNEKQKTENLLPQQNP
jgi:hypothetical protein